MEGPHTLWCAACCSPGRAWGCPLIPGPGTGVQGSSWTSKMKCQTSLSTNRSVRMLGWQEGGSAVSAPRAGAALQASGTCHAEACVLRYASVRALAPVLLLRLHAAIPASVPSPELAQFACTGWRHRHTMHTGCPGDLPREACPDDWLLLSN